MYNAGLKITYRLKKLSFSFFDLATGKVTHTITCDLSTQRGRQVANEIRWSHGIPDEIFDKVEEYIVRALHEQ